MKKLLLSTIFILGISIFTKAQITNSDIELLIESYPGIVTDLGKLDSKYSGDTDLSAIQAYGASDEVKAVLKKHGWADDYMTKIPTIASGYAYLKMDKEMKDLPEEQQAYMKQMLAQYGQSVSAQDLDVLRGKYTELDTFFTEQSK